MSIDLADRIVEVRRIISLFDLTAADNPGAIISRPLLRGRNYDEWACAFKTVLCSRKKFGFLDGSITKPLPPSPDYEDWEPISALIVSWIKMTIKPSLISNISHRDNTKEMWDHIKKRFAVTSGSKMQQIKADLANCRQNRSTIKDYFGRLTKIWDNIAAYRPLQICKCGACTYDLLSQQEKVREEDQIHQFLFGLDDRSFASIRSTLTARTPFTNLEEVYNLIKQEEDMQNSSRICDDKPPLQHLRHNSHRMSLKLALGRLCIYPEWWGEWLRSRTGTGQGKGKPQWNGQNKQPIFANAVMAHSVHNGTGVSNSDRNALVGLSDAQWQAIRQVLNVGITKSTETLSSMSTSPSWILDTGCTHHMTGKISALSNIREISPIMVVLADGTERLSVKEGTVVLPSKLILESVFYVEELKTDLISLGQLMDKTNSVLQVAPQFLIIHDQITRMVTGVDKRELGTFYFSRVETVASINTKESAHLWHT